MTPDETTESSNPTDTELLASVTTMLEARIAALKEGLVDLASDCTEEDRERLSTHPEYRKGTTERWAWHAGNISGKADTLRMIKKRILWPVEDDD